MFQQLIAPAISFGISAAVMPGPLIAYLVNVTLTLGWRKGALVVLSPLITDAPIIVLMTFILDQLPPGIVAAATPWRRLPAALYRLERAEAISRRSHLTARAARG